MKHPDGSAGRFCLRTALLLPLALMALLAGSIQPAQAAAGSAFDPNVPLILASKSANAGDPTALYRLAPAAGGNYEFTQIGPDADLVYNALTFNTDDNYLYAISGEALSSGVPAGSLLKIGSGGGYDVVGTGVFQEAGRQTNMGAYHPGEKVFYVLSAQGETIFRIDLDPGSGTYGELINTVNVSPADHNAQGGGSDFTYANGAFWTLGSGGIFRIGTDGTTDSWPVPVGAEASGGGSYQAGAAWTFLGDDLGFSYNGTGEVVRIRVTNPGSTTPTFTTISKVSGAPSGQNDGAAITGTVDLALQKTGQLVGGGAQVSYQLTVTNNGPADSSGWTVTDTLPSGLSNVQVGGAGTATVSGDTVTVVGGPLVSGDSAVITITANTPSPRPSSLANTASVEGQDVDTNPSNNTDSVTLTFATDLEGVDPPDTGAHRESMSGTYLALAAGLLMLGLLSARALVLRRRP